MIHARHSHRRWLIARHHAARVRNAKLRRHPHTFGADWYSTDTADWRCIRTLEEGMAQAPANEFGFVPYYGGMSHAQQSALALSILHNYGWGAWSTAPACGL